METPSSTRRVTRSQTLATSHDTIISISRKIEDSGKNVSKSKPKEQQEDRSALIDITNDSPIVGLASDANLETPLGKQRRSRVKNTPGSGEALLRCQVKTLLQKVEEEAEFSKFSFESMGMGILAPTQASTPQIQNLPGFVSAIPSIVPQQPLFSQVVSHVFDGKNEENSEKSLISSLLLDFSDTSEEEYSSEMSYEEVTQGEGNTEKSTATTEDDDASVWSMQVNASTQDEEDEDEEVPDEEEEEEEEEEDYYEDIEEGEEEYDELCEVLNNISMDERKVPKSEGKHTRFVYNSDDELVKEEVEENSDKKSASSNMMLLKGLPTPEGKHVRFCEEEEEAKSAL
ncbi:hypothetical protein RJT34_06012 [Clitoria ternatea]|uniref:Uncharacterized protein n=1 Tax=Clitoria ternatea TaxID=43366 RepID=A0AAN9K3M8_CLITE